MPNKVIIVGAGRISWLLEQDPLRYKPCTHAGALKTLTANSAQRKLEITAIVDPDMERARALSNFLAITKPNDVLIAKNFSAVKKLSPPDIIIIAASSEAHFQLFKQALALKPRHIVIEKPVAVTKAQARKMRSIARRTSTLIWPNYERRFHPKYRYWKSHLSSRLGEVLGYRGLFLAPNHELFPTRKWEGVLLHDTTHLLDLTQFFFGSIQHYETNHTTLIHHLWCRHKSGISGEITTIAGAKAFHLELEIIGSKGRLSLGNGFTRWEPVQKSQLYSRFFSFGAPVILPEVSITKKNNPFLQLYRQILDTPTENLHNEYFSDACANAEILATK